VQSQGDHARHSERSEESLVGLKRFLGRWCSLGMTIRALTLAQNDDPAKRRPCDIAQGDGGEGGVVVWRV
jgi:hypothetical protein